MKLALFILLLIGFSPLSFGITGSITDPGFSLRKEKKPLEPLLGPVKGSFKTRLSRNLIISEDNFWSPFRRDGFFDTLSLKSDLSLSYALTETFSSLNDSRFFDELDLFFVLSYQRPIYADLQEIKQYCLKSYLCFGDVSLGVSHPLSLKESPVKGQYSLYLSLPYLSKSFFKQKKLLGIGSSLSTEYLLFAKEKIQLSGISSHFLDVSAYSSKWGDIQQTFYNDFLSLFNQLGLRFYYSKNSFVPLVLAYANHLFSLNLNGTPFHRLSLGFSSVWSVSRVLHFIVSLNWGDEVLKPKGSADAVKTRPFNPNRTFINGGFSYSF